MNYDFCPFLVLYIELYLFSRNFGLQKQTQNTQFCVNPRGILQSIAGLKYLLYASLNINGLREMNIEHYRYIYHIQTSRSRDVA